MPEAHPSEHAEQRLYERFNLILDDELTRQLACKIDNGASALLGYQDNTRELHAVEIAGRTVVVVWQPRDRIFVTFLHPDEFRSRLVALGSAAMPNYHRPSPLARRKKPRPSDKLSRQKAHALRLARHAEWMEEMAAQELRTRRRWYELGRGIAPGSRPEFYLHPTHPNTVKFYHVSVTVSQEACRHEWVEGTTDLYCLLCQLSPQRREGAGHLVTPGDRTSARELAPARSPVYVRAMPDFSGCELEYAKDDRTLWVNGPDGLVARFGVFGIDIHLAGSCEGGYCTHTRTTNADWEVFKQKMLEIYNVVVSDEHKPDRLAPR